MTHREDPNMPRRPMVQDETSYSAWVLGILAALLIAGGAILAFNNSGDTQMAGNTTGRPAATQPASPPASPPSTTGSGTTSPANR